MKMVIRLLIIFAFIFINCKGQEDGKSKKSSKEPVITENYDFPILKKDKHVKDWFYPQVHSGFAKLDDKYSPRIMHFSSKIKEYKDPDDAVEDAIKTAKIDSPDYLPLEKLDISDKMVGSKEYITLGTCNLNGASAILFVNLYSNKDKWNLNIVQIPKTVYKKWGGAISLLSIGGLIKSKQGVPKKQVDRILNATPQQQIKLYEAAHRKIIMDLYKGILMTKAQTVMTMQELNYDLILGGDISNPIVND